MAEQAVGPGAAALLEAGLQGPDFLDHAVEAAGEGQGVPLPFQHRVHGVVEGGLGTLAGVLVALPFRFHVEPEQAGQHEGRGGGMAPAHPFVGVVEGGMDEFLPGGIVQDGVQHGQDAVVQALGPQLPDTPLGMTGKQQLHHLVEQPGGRDALQHGGQFGDGRPGGRVDLELQLGGEPGGPKHAHRVLPKALEGVADHAQHLFPGVLHAAVPVPDFLFLRVVIEGVDGEIPAGGVLFLAAKDIVPQQHAVLGGNPGFVLLDFRLGRAGSEGGDLDEIGAAIDMDDLKAAADEAGAAKDLLHFVRRGVSGHVEVLGFPVQQQVAHGAAHHEGGVARFAQGAGGLHGAGGNPFPADAVGFEGQDARARSRFLPEYLVE